MQNNIPEYLSIHDRITNAYAMASSLMTIAGVILTKSDIMDPETCFFASAGLTLVGFIGMTANIFKKSGLSLRNILINSALTLINGSAALTFYKDWFAASFERLLRLWGF